MEPLPGHPFPPPEVVVPRAQDRPAPMVRGHFGGPLMGKGGHGRDPCDADLVAFGAPFLADPDPPERPRTGAALG